MESKKVRNLLIINFLILIGLVFTPPIGYFFFKIFINNFNKLLVNLNVINTTVEINSKKSDYPTYSNKEEANAIYRDLFLANSTKFDPFTGWRRKSYNLETISISNKYGIRNGSEKDLKNSTWFMGGSTIWGTGVTDSQTIPYFFQTISNIKTVNLGESGWNSRQSLNLLLNLVSEGHNPSNVVFYEGVNEIIQCRVELENPPTYVYEKLFRGIFDYHYLRKDKKLFNFLAAPYVDLSKRLKTKKTRKMHDCDTNPKKAETIASNLINNWIAAQAIADKNNFRINFVLQPHLWSSQTDTSYLKEYINSPEVKSLEKQYKVIYPLIEKKISNICTNQISTSKFCSNIINAKNWISIKTEPVFTDFCHLNAEGNKEIAKKLSKKILTR